MTRLQLVAGLLLALAAPVYAAQVIECTDEALHAAIALIETNCLTYTAAEKTIEFDCVGGTEIEVAEDIGDRSQDLDCDNNTGNDSWQSCGSANCLTGCSTCPPSDVAGGLGGVTACTRAEYSWLADRELNCEGMTIDGEGTAGGNVKFVLTPGCHATGRAGGTNTEHQSGLFRIVADDITIRNLDAEDFFEGIQIRPDPERGQTADGATITNLNILDACDEHLTAAVAPGGREWIVDKHAANATDSGPGTESQPFLSPAGCIAKMKGGDTCSIKGPGPYVNVGPSADVPGWNFCDCTNECNGTEEAPTIIRGYPGHRPKFCSNSGCDTSLPGYFRVAIGGFEPAGGSCEWLTFRSLTSDGRMSFFGDRVIPPFILRNIRLEDIQFEGAGDDGGSTCGSADFNPGMLHYKGVDGFSVSNSHFGVHVSNPCGGRMSQLVGFQGEDITIEHNEFDTRGGSNGFYAWHDSHANNATRVNIRYNWFRGTGMVDIGGPELCTGVTCPPDNCCPGVTEIPAEGSDSHVYGNLFTEASQGPTLGGVKRSRITMGRCEDCSIESNTFIGAYDPLWITQDPVGGLVVRDNLIHALSQGGESGGRINLITGWDAGSPTPDLSDTSFDYNIYDPAGVYRVNLYAPGDSEGTIDTLAEWQTHLGGGCAAAADNECNSTEAVTCTFANTTNYAVSGPALSACLTGSHDGDKIGWEGVTDCVGRFCNLSTAYSLDGISISDASFERGSGTCVAAADLAEAAASAYPTVAMSITDSTFEDCSTPLSVTDGRVLLDGNTFSDTADAGAIDCQHVQLGTTGIEGHDPAVYMLDNTSSGCLRAVVAAGNSELISLGGNTLSGEAAGVVCKDFASLAGHGGIVPDTFSGSGAAGGSLSLGLGGVSIQDGCVAVLGDDTISIDGENIWVTGNNILADNVSPKSCSGGGFDGFPCDVDLDCPPAGNSCVAGSVTADLVDRRLGGGNMPSISAQNNQWDEPGVADPVALIHGQGEEEVSVIWDPVCLDAPCGVAPPTTPGTRLSGVRVVNVRISSE